MQALIAQVGGGVSCAPAAHYSTVHSNNAIRKNKTDKVEARAPCAQAALYIAFAYPTFALSVPLYSVA